MSSFFVGTAPFCDPQPEQCEKTPGYVADGYSKCGSGNCCWTGRKIKCRFDETAWKKSQLYKSSKEKSDNPSFVWIGKAPLCGASFCDAYEAGLYPLGTDSCGDGSCCMVGEKVLTKKPETKYEQEMVDKGMKECFALDKEKEKTIQEGFKFAGGLASAVGKLIPL